MYEKAAEIIAQTKNKYVHSDLQKAQNVLKSFCRLNGIEISL